MSNFFHSSIEGLELLDEVTKDDIIDYYLQDDDSNISQTNLYLKW